MRSFDHSPYLLATALLTAAGCTSSTPIANAPQVDSGVPSAPADPALLGSRARKELEEIKAEWKATANLSADTLLAARTLPHIGLSYDPAQAEYLPLIQGSSLALGDDALGVLSDKGFVLDASQSFPTFFYGYHSIYSQDLPVYVSADSVLDAVHRGYDGVLLSVENHFLRQEMAALLEDAQAALRAGTGSAFGNEAVADAEQYLEVARLLLSGKDSASLSLGGSEAEVEALVADASAAEGLKSVELWGQPRAVDFSQFTPRGHYTDEPEMQRYFRALMWLGRVDLRLVETLPTGEQVLRPRQLRVTLALGQVFQGELLARWQRIDDVLQQFVGESDSLTPAGVGELARALDVQDTAGLDALSEEEAIATILQGGFGAQRILSHMMVNGMDSGTLPLNSSYLVLGQRYIVDSHVLSNVVWDRTQSKRMMPDPLDAAYAALANDQAAALLKDELETYGYAPNLHMTRFLVDAYEPEFWESSLYNRWLASLRAMSPVAEEVMDPAAVGMPEVTGTEAWGRRVLNTQLASWSQLRHDTLLYAKQSYTSGAGCEYPDAYVDPYPEVFERLRAYAQSGQQLHTSLAALPSHSDYGPVLLDLIQTYFGRLEEITGMLSEMATAQRQGVPFDEAQMAFINDAVLAREESVGCVVVDVPTGWYARLFFEPEKSLEVDPIIADVHTQPTDEAGNVVGRVLHVATGLPRLMVVTVDTCEGPRAYAGLSFAYHEKVTEDFERLTDEQWSESLMQSHPLQLDWGPPEVGWLEDVIAP